jgi:GPH family glycoside/pentoside/hexuronide:cation symporter
VIDYDEYRTRQRKEGAYTAAWGFALKFAIGFQIMVTGVVLQLAGFAPNVDQTSVAKLALRLLSAGMPFVFFLLGAVILGRFRLNEREHAEIRTRIEARRSQA